MIKKDLQTAIKLAHDVVNLKVLAIERKAQALNCLHEISLPHTGRKTRADALDLYRLFKAVKILYAATDD